MPPIIIVGLLSLVVALFAYSMGAWGVFRHKTVSQRDVIYLWAGLGFDCIATAMMAVAAGGLDLSPLPDMLHTVFAFVAMAGMVAAAYVATLALGDEEKGASLAKWILAPWAVWIAMFAWGLIARGGPGA